MNLVVFDVDGTLVNSRFIDSDCYTRTVKEILQIESITEDRREFNYSTDSGILLEIYQNNFFREPLPEEVEIFKSKFFFHLSYQLESELKQNSANNAIAISGASFIFDYVRQHKNWYVAIATGGWKQSAEMKLSAAQIPFSDISIATADEGIHRVDIISNAVQKVKFLYGIKQFSSCIYVGDRAWDYAAASHLGFGFIGIGDDEQMKKVVPNDQQFANYLSADKFMCKLLELGKCS